MGKVAEAVAGPAVGGIFGLGGALLGNKAQGKATDANLQAQREALAYEKQKDAARKQEYDEALGMYKAQMDAWNQNRAALARRYGINIPTPTGAPMSAGQPAGRPRVTLGAIMGRGAPQAPAPMASPQMSPEGWEDWSRYATARR